MKNQWTTVSDSSHKAHRKNEEQKTPKKNKTIALAMASLGVFLIIAGATPFFFSGKDPSSYSAFLGTNSQSGEDLFVPAVDVTFEDGEEIVSEPIEVAVDIEEKEKIIAEEKPEEMTISLDDLMEEEEETIITIPEVEFQEEVAEEDSEEKVDLKEERFTDPEIILDDGGDKLLASEITLITETDDFPINTHTGETVDPIVLARTATAEQLHSVAKENPETGLPLLPLLAFSAGAALIFHRKKDRL